MIVKEVELVAEPFLPIRLTPLLRRIVLDKRRKTVHIFMMDGEWLCHVPPGASDTAAIKAVSFCFMRNN